MKETISHAEIQRCVDLLTSARVRCGEISTWHSYRCDYPTHPGERFAGQSLAPTHAFRLDPSSIELRLVDCQFPDGLPAVPPQIKHIRMTRCSFPDLRALSSWKGVSLATDDCKGGSLEGVDDVEFVSLSGQELWPGLGKNVKALQLNWWLGDLRHLPTGLEALFLEWHQSALSWEELHMPKRELELLSLFNWRISSLAALTPPPGLKVLLIDLCSSINTPPDWSLFSGLIALSLYNSHSNRRSKKSPLEYEPISTLPELIAALPNLQACELCSSRVEKEGPPKNRRQFNWSKKYDLRLALLKRLAPPAAKKTSIQQRRKLPISDDEETNILRLRKLLTSDDEKTLSEGLAILRQGEPAWGEAILKGTTVEENTVKASSFSGDAKKGNLLRVIAAAPESPWIQALRESVQCLKLQDIAVDLGGLAALPNLRELTLDKCQVRACDGPLPALKNLFVRSTSSWETIRAPSLQMLYVFQDHEVMLSCLGDFPLLQRCEITSKGMFRLDLTSPLQALTHLAVRLNEPDEDLSLRWLDALPKLQRLTISFFGNVKRASLTDVERLNHSGLQEVRLLDVEGQEALAERLSFIQTHRLPR